MNPIPEAAIPMRDFIRKMVPKPEELPESKKTEYGVRALRWQSKRWYGLACCPMGLLSSAKNPSPADNTQFTGIDEDWLTELCVIDFGHWWDSHTDPKEAVEAVWG